MSESGCPTFYGWKLNSHGPTRRIHVIFISENLNDFQLPKWILSVTGNWPKIAGFMDWPNPMGVGYPLVFWVRRSSLQIFLSGLKCVKKICVPEDEDKSV